jgi:hypothetical protein
VSSRAVVRRTGLALVLLSLTGHCFASGLVPLAVDKESFTFGLEADLSLSPVAKQHFWRIVIPNTTNTDFEAMLRDGVQNQIGLEARPKSRR